MLGNIQSIQQEENRRKIEDVQKKLHEINARIIQQQTRDKDSQAKNDTVESTADWTSSYKKWENWSDVDDLLAAKQSTEAQIESLYDQKDILGHTHDHSKEREFFILPEETKIKKCEQYKDLGNYLFREGMFDRAAIQYQIVVGYYEYIFPEDPVVQKHLDDLRYFCLSNLGLCYIRMKEYRRAVEVCSTVINNPNNPALLKALFRRGIAFRYLDEYENALNDFTRVKQLKEDDRFVEHEIIVTRKLIQGYDIIGRKFANSVLGNTDTVVKENSFGGDRDTHDTLMKKYSFFDPWKPVEPVFGDSLELITDALVWANILD